MAEASRLAEVNGLQARPASIAEPFEFTRKYIYFCSRLLGLREDVVLALGKIGR
jgi:hypothetical protein